VKVWITKYALTKGIFEANGEIFSDEYPNIIDIGVSVSRLYYSKPHWHTSAEAANARADKMRQAKIEYHRKAIAELEKIRFG